MIGVLVSGSGTNLQALLDAGLPVVAAASNRADAYALERARAADVDVAAFPIDEYPSRDRRDGAMAEWLADRGVKLVVCAGYMHLLTPTFLERFPASVINVHPSLLPEFPGTHAVEEALEAGAVTTGVTVHYVDEGVDTGPVISQCEIAINAGETADSLLERIHQVEHRLLPEVATRLVEELRSAATR